jgi:Protein of unknown function (DUF2934)
MDEVWRQQVRERALAIWQREGKPVGSPDQFGPMAEQELLAEGQTPSMDQSPDRPQDKAQVDEETDASLPTSQPPAWTSETGAGTAKGAKAPKPS